MRRQLKYRWLFACLIWLAVMVPMVIVFFVVGFIVQAGAIGIEAAERLTARIDKGLHP